MTRETFSSPPGLDAAEYARHRAAFLKRLDRAVAVIPAGVEALRNGDSHFRFRAHSDFAYLTDFPEPHAVAVFKGGDDKPFRLFVPPRDPEKELWTGLRAGPEGAVARYGADEAFPITELDAKLAELLEGADRLLCPLGVDAVTDEIVLRHFKRCQSIATARSGAAVPVALEGLREALHELRLRKSPAELAIMRHAARLSCQGHQEAWRLGVEGAREYQLAAAFEHFSAWRGARHPAYASIVAAGANACVLHYVSNDAVLRREDLVLIDAGCELHGYASDLTRCFPVSGRFSPEQRLLYEICLHAQTAALALAKPGATMKALHECAVRALVEGLVGAGLMKGSIDTIIEEESFKPFYPHRTGHWLGMDTHDVGRVRDGEESSRPLQPGMVLTVEPGLYLAPGMEKVDARFHGIGIRIEDDLVITDDAHEVLTAACPKRVEDIEAAIARLRDERPLAG